jgi:plastocyanin
VKVANDDSTAHTLTADDDRSFDSGTVQPGASATVKAPKAGTYAYHCTIHPFMKGTLVAS